MVAYSTALSIPSWRANRRKLLAFRSVARRRSETRCSSSALLERVVRLYTHETLHPERGLAAKTRALWTVERLGYAFARRARRLDSLRDSRVSRATSPVLHVGMGVCAAEFGELNPELVAKVIDKLARPDDADFAYESFGAVLGLNERRAPRWLIGLKRLPKPSPDELLARFEPRHQPLIAHGYGRLLYFHSATLETAIAGAAQRGFLDNDAAIQGIGFAYAMVNHSELPRVLATALPDHRHNEHFQAGITYALVFWDWLFPGALEDFAPQEHPLVTRAAGELTRARAAGRLPAFALSDP